MLGLHMENIRINTYSICVSTDQHAYRRANMRVYVSTRMLWASVMSLGPVTQTKYSRLWQFPPKLLHPEIHQIHKLRFLGISRYTFKLRFWLNKNLYQEIWDSGFGGLRWCSLFSGNCPTSTTYVFQNINESALQIQQMYFNISTSLFESINKVVVCACQQLRASRLAHHVRNP